MEVMVVVVVHHNHFALVVMFHVIGLACVEGRDVRGGNSCWEDGD
jgi:hypothetical protein